MNPRRVALALGLTGIVFSLSGHAQAPVTPAGSPPDLKTFLFRASDALGILRGLQQEDSLTTLEFWARGTMTVGTRAYRVSSYRGSLRFHAVPSMRADITRSGPDGAQERVVEAVAGPFGWNESEPGVKPSPAPDVAADRMIFLRTLPQGFLKGARIAGDKVRIASEGSNIVVRYQIPEVPDAELTATLNSKYIIERVDAKRGAVVTETTFANYADWNAKDYKADIWFPGRIVQKRAGAITLDLTITKTNTYNPYVVVPVPPSVGTLDTGGAKAGQAAGASR